MERDIGGDVVSAAELAKPQPSKVTTGTNRGDLWDGVAVMT